MDTKDLHPTGTQSNRGGISQRVIVEMADGTYIRITLSPDLTKEVNNYLNVELHLKEQYKITVRDLAIRDVDVIDLSHDELRKNLFHKG